MVALGFAYTVIVAKNCNLNMRVGFVLKYAAFVLILFGAS